MISDNIIYILIFVCLLFLIGIIFYQYTKTPSIIGLSLHEAEKKLIVSGKKIKLGTKVGFIEPPQSKPYLLGKIAEQILVSPLNQEFSLLNYKLYQINVDRLFSQFSNSTSTPNPFENQTIQPIEPIQPQSINNLDPIDYQPQLIHEKIQTEENKQIYVKDQDGKDPLQKPIQKPLPLQNVSSAGSVKETTPNNEFKSSFQLFPVPKAANNTRHYGNKTSYFW